MGKEDAVISGLVVPLRKLLAISWLTVAELLEAAKHR
jgi:hypothetical protein